MRSALETTAPQLGLFFFSQLQLEGEETQEGKKTGARDAVRNPLVQKLFSPSAGI